VIEVAVGSFPSARHLSANFLTGIFFYEPFIDRPHTRKRVCLVLSGESPKERYQIFTGSRSFEQRPGRSFSLV